METTILSCPLVLEDTKQIGYGGDQAWFKDKWAIKAGCASVCATNVLLYYVEDKREFEKDEYVKCMEDMFTIMEPKHRGFPYAYLYARRLKKVLDLHNYHLQYRIVRNPYPDDALALVKKSVHEKHPISLLILTHRRRKVRDDLWHWVTIFGYKETPKGIDIIFSDCGEKKEIPARILFEKHRFNVIKMVIFDKQ